MWMRAPVLVLVVLYFAAPAHPAQMGDETDICAMTEVLVAMKQLLTMLTTEISDLRQQVKTSCQPGDAADADTTRPTKKPDISPAEPEVMEGTPKPDEAISTEAMEDDDEDLDLDLDSIFTLEVEKEEKEEELDYDDVEENPVSEVITGLANWWENFSPFAPKPTTTKASPTSQPDEDEQDEFEEEEDEEADADEDDVPYPRPPSPPRPQPRPRPTTTTTTPVPYTLPPAPTRCPSPFQLLAEGCYLVVHDSRDWRSWGEAYAYCQSYRGKLAAPWRVRQLQEYLSLYYSDAFWVGARFLPATRAWEWLTGRRVEQGEWKPGQPDKNPGKRCVFLDKWSGYRANNFYCGEKYPFVCDATGV